MNLPASLRLCASTAPLVASALLPLLVLLAAPAGAQAPSGPSAEAPRAGAQRKVAVPDVRARGGVESSAVEGLGGLIASELAREPALLVLAASDIAAMLGFERERALLGCADSSCLAELGGALGVDLVVASEVSRVGQTYLLNVSLVDIRKARALARVTRTTAGPDGLVVAAREAVGELLATLRGGAAIGPAPSSPPATAPPAAVVASDGSTQRILGLSLAGLGVALAATGGWQGLVARSSASDVSALAKRGGSWDGEAQSLEAEGQAAGTRALILGGAGGAALVAGGLLYLLAPDAGPSSGGLTASIDTTGARLAWTASY